MKLYDGDKTESFLVNSKVKQELFLLDKHRHDFDVVSKGQCAVDYGYGNVVVELALPESHEYASRTLMEQAIVLRLLYVRHDQRGKGLGKRVLKKVVDAYKDSEVVLLLYPIPVEMKPGTSQPRMVENLELQKRLILFYQTMGLACLKYEKIYDIRALMELMHRYTYKHIAPCAMGMSFKNTPAEVKKVLEDCTITSEEMFQDLKKESDYVPEIPSVHLSSSRYVT